jgi:hypothetical protein
LSAIKVGDLVAIVNACCSVVAAEGLGAHFVVASIKHRDMMCSACGWRQEGLAAFPDHKILGKFDRAPVVWLKRIPPLDELERDKIVEELAA